MGHLAPRRERVLGEFVSEDLCNVRVKQCIAGLNQRAAIDPVCLKPIADTLQKRLPYSVVDRRAKGTLLAG